YRFLVLEPGFPRAILFCLQQAQKLLAEVRASPNAAIGAPSSTLSHTLVTALEELDRQASPLERDPHEVLTWIVDTTAQLCSAISQDYFTLTTPTLSSIAEDNHSNSVASLTTP
ncbi:MAG: alpha-E domain-containing protein, partial [Myxococcota bacterium]